MGAHGAVFEVRRVMALRADALSACNRIFAEELARWRKESAGIASAQTASLTFVQRFNATLGGFVHVHLVAPDGVFSRAEKGAVLFHAGRAPSPSDIADVSGRACERMTKWLRRRDVLDTHRAEERSNEAPLGSPLEAPPVHEILRNSQRDPAPCVRRVASCHGGVRFAPKHGAHTRANG